MAKTKTRKLAGARHYHIYVYDEDEGGWVWEDYRTTRGEAEAECKRCFAAWPTYIAPVRIPPMTVKEE